MCLTFCQAKNDNMIQRRQISAWKSISLVGLFVLALLGVALFARQPIAEAWSQATTRTARPYTSLSYINTGNLPTYAPAGSTQYITFRITNHEAAAVPYAYRALLSTGSQAAVLQEGTLMVPDGASADRTIPFSLPQPNMDATIIVQLIDRSEYITFGTKS